MATMNFQQQTFGDMLDEPTLFQKESGKIDVVKMDYIEAESMDWKDLFSGFTSLKAITFSSGIGFIGRLLDLFEKSEIIFGCEAVMSYNLQEIMAFQNQLIERIRKESGKATKKILDRIDKGDVHLYVARTQLSHEKIYLLSHEDGRKRVVMGSANMSFNAFSGHQRENICYIDGERAYDWYMDVFESLKANSTD